MKRRSKENWRFAGTAIRQNAAALLGGGLVLMEGQPPACPFPMVAAALRATVQPDPRSAIAGYRSIQKLTGKKKRSLLP
jgi:hypothetical protein